jgi:Transcription factor WhiB
MAAAAAPDRPQNTALLELALALGYRVTDQRWRARARCAGADPETFLPERDASLEAPLRYCRGVGSPNQCVREALALGQGAWAEPGWLGSLPRWGSARTT